MENIFTLTDLLRIGGSVFGVIGALLSLGLILFPEQVLRLNNFLNKKISTDKLRLALEKEFDITSIIMQARVLAGVVTLLLSLILLIISIRL
ncbi:MAG: hypothetical protein AB1629_01340 [Candidatus Omnitrophota bacterium]